MNSIIYARISRDPDDQRLGVDRQDKRGREVAERNGWTVTDVLEDNDASGTNADRPGFEELNRRIASGAVGAVIVQDQDRIARNLRILLPFADLCAEHDVRLESWGGPLDLVTADGELVASVKGATDAHYARKLSEKSKAGHKDLADAGRPNGGIRAFGFAENRIDHNDVEADLIREAADNIISGASLRSIETDWHGQGIVTSTGKPFVSVVIRRMLLNPRLVGKRQVGHWEKNPATGKKRRVVDKVVDGVWEPILTQEQFDRVGAVLRSPTAPKRDTTTLKYWLRGVTFCGKCGNRIGSVGMPGGRRAYRCEPAPVGCGGVKASADGAEATVESAVLEYLSGDRDLQVGEDPLELVGITPDHDAQRPLRCALRTAAYRCVEPVCPAAFVRFANSWVADGLIVE